MYIQSHLQRVSLYKDCSINLASVKLYMHVHFQNLYFFSHDFTTLYKQVKYFNKVSMNLPIGLLIF